MPDHRLVVVGGGIAGLDLATQLAGRVTAKGRLQVTLVDRESAHVWKPMLHTFAAGTQNVYQQQTAYMAQARERGFIYHLGEVVGVNREARSVLLAPLLDAQGSELLGRRHIGYDTLVLAFGSRANDFGTPGVTEHCLTIDSRGQAMAFNDIVRLRILQSLIKNTPLHIAIVGGGATGVELAAELVQLAEQAENYGAAGTREKVRITLVEAGARLLAAFPEQISVAARERLESLGIAMEVATRVGAAEAAGLRLQDGRLLACDVMVWAAGVRATTTLSGLEELETTRSDQLVIRPDLRTTRDPAIFALGDCASLTLPGQQRPLPPTAQVAHQQAVYLSRRIPALLEGEPTPAFTYRDFGSLVSLGGYDAFGSLGRLGFFKGGFIRGRVAQFGHAMLYRAHQARLHGFWRGNLLWLADRLTAGARPTIRVD